MVASTNVYGDIVRQIAGDKATITSIISDPSADPHSYEANTRTQLELSKADVVIENGGGYDDFVDTMLKSANSDAKVLNAVQISGHTATGGAELNEHVWYDLPSMSKLADEIAGALSAADAGNAATFAANATTFKQKLQELEGTAAQIKTAHTGAGVAITEPVPVYLLEACGLANKTPDEFSEAIEEGTDVPAGVLRETLGLFTGKQVRLLAYNEQTAGPETEKVLQAAKDSNVGVVPVTETLPAGKDYLTWMGGNLDAIRTALG
ncbi:zinc ABC transporter substrate-binding protein [Asanoa sp. NPDC050611]|uniref:metal ABC transporter solute-binding protein, Zn/Mn family n=1 Tax=Asanoa sp. NPDC050611 TaxID=3157098 RepID=UPI003405200F